MTVIKWRDSYTIGVEEMDEEHKKLIEIINRLFQMIRDKKSYEELNEIYESLVAYTEQHFQHEEKLLDEAEYPRLEEQRTLHAEFVKKLEEMKNNLTSADESIAPVVYKFLRDWWVQHIVGEDKLYGDFFEK